MPSKYLLGRYRASGFSKGNNRASKKTIVNWKGYTFSVSRKTLYKELWSRNDIFLDFDYQHGRGIYRLVKKH